MFIAHEPQIPAFKQTHKWRTSVLNRLRFGNVLQLPRYRPSLQERRKVRVESSSFLILISASRTIGPQLQEQETDQVKKGNNASSVRRKSWHFSGISIRRGENKQWNTYILLGFMKCYKTFDSIKTNKVARQTTLHHQPFTSRTYVLRSMSYVCMRGLSPGVSGSHLYTWNFFIRGCAAGAAAVWAYRTACRAKIQNQKEHWWYEKYIS